LDGGPIPNRELAPHDEVLNLVVGIEKKEIRV